MQKYNSKSIGQIKEKDFLLGPKLEEGRLANLAKYLLFMVCDDDLRGHFFAQQNKFSIH